MASCTGSWTNRSASSCRSRGAQAMRFQEALDRFQEEISTTAPGQWVPGLERDDVQNEMLMCLSTAADTFNPGKAKTFGVYWWSIWLNRKYDITASYYAAKRPVLVLDSPLDSLLEEQAVRDRPHFPDAPRGSSLTERLVWQMVGQGDRVTEVMAATHISRRGYYDIIHKWRTEVVRRDLHHA